MEQWTANTAPHVTVIRPVKGLEPSLYDCLASTFLQRYPRESLHIRLCVSDRNDPALPVLERVIRNFPALDAQILVEDEDVALHDGSRPLGPNPKIRNMSHAYRDAPGNIVWIIDCNVWVGRGVCGRMVAKLEGRGSRTKYKYVHVLPIVVDTVGTTARQEIDGFADSHTNGPVLTTSSAHDYVQRDAKHHRTMSSIGGGRLEEQFLASAHPKFYTAINTVLIAPCSVGKCTMFRRSHLDSLTNGSGIDYFSENICEDHLIGDLLWKRPLPEEAQGEVWGKHALVFGDLAIQPMANMSLYEYWKRRIRWLRVRKFTVTLATLVEPGTESFLCSLYGAFAFTNLPFLCSTTGMSPSWTTFSAFWLSSVSIWCIMDWRLYLLLQSGASIEVDEDTPTFAQPPPGGQRRPFLEWLLGWLGREALALPIWIWAFWGGTEVEWRGKKFWVGMDMKVHEVKDRTSRPVEEKRADRSQLRSSIQGKRRAE